MFTIHNEGHLLSPELQATVITHLEEKIRPLLKADVSNYAKGRQRVWLPYEAPLSASRSWTLGVQDERLWDWIVRTCQTTAGMTPDLGLISVGGAINRHRDAPYAGWRSVLINLGKVTFNYEPLYPEFKWTADVPEKGTPEAYDLTGGEVISFNPKNPHWVTNVDPNRWGINVWTVSTKEAKRFTAFKAANTNIKNH